MKFRINVVPFVIFLLAVCSSFAFAQDEEACFSPSDAVTLETYVQMLPELNLARGIEKSLAAKMRNAAMLISKGQFTAASNLLKALAQEVLAQEGKKISPELVQGILEKIQELRYCEFEFTPLEFPFENPGHIERLHSFGIPNWSGTEPHNGIDLILKTGVTTSRIISPVEGRVSRIEVSENPFSDPPEQIIIHLVITVNNEWSVALVFEPSAAGEPMRTSQLAAIRVNVGDYVSKGSYLGDLLAGDLGLPHIHYMVSHNDQTVCAYDYSSTEAQSIFQAIPLSQVPGGPYISEICIPIP